MTTKRHESQKRAEQKYKREKTKTVNLRFSPVEADLYDFIAAKENRSAYLKGLVRADMERHRQEGRTEESAL